MRTIKDIPGDVRAARKALGWTQERLGQALGKDQSYVAHLERGMFYPSAQMLFKLIRALPGFNPFVPSGSNEAA